MKIVAVTACPTGTAITYMAAIRLAAAGKELGHDLKIETQGAMGIENPLSPKDIARADGVIIAADIEIAGADRFIGVPVVKVSTVEAINDAKLIISRITPAAVGGDAGTAAGSQREEKAPQRSTTKPPHISNS